MVVVVAFIARALFSSVAITSSGIRVKNAFRGEIAATWDQIREFQIVYTRRCRCAGVTLSDGTKVKIHAFEWPGSMNVLLDVHNWLAQYDSPLRLHDQRWWQHTFRNDNGCVSRALPDVTARSRGGSTRGHEPEPHPAPRRPDPRRHRRRRRDPRREPHRARRPHPLGRAALHHRRGPARHHPSHPRRPLRPRCRLRTRPRLDLDL